MKYRIHIFLFFLFIGCTYWFKMVVDGVDPFRPVFKSEESFWNILTGNTFFVSSFRVDIYDIEKRELRKKVWHFGRTEEKDLEKIVYGETPEGFKEYVVAEKLLPETDYMVDAYGKGGGGM